MSESSPRSSSVDSKTWVALAGMVGLLAVVPFVCDPRCDADTGTAPGDEFTTARGLDGQPPQSVDTGESESPEPRPAGATAGETTAGETTAGETTAGQNMAHVTDSTGTGGEETGGEEDGSTSRPDVGAPPAPIRQPHGCVERLPDAEPLDESFAVATFNLYWARDWRRPGVDGFRAANNEEWRWKAFAIAKAIEGAEYPALIALQEIGGLRELRSIQGAISGGLDDESEIHYLGGVKGSQYKQKAGALWNSRYFEACRDVEPIVFYQKVYSVLLHRVGKPNQLVWFISGQFSQTDPKLPENQAGVLAKEIRTQLLRSPGLTVIFGGDLYAAPALNRKAGKIVQTLASADPERCTTRTWRRGSSKRFTARSTDGPDRTSDWLVVCSPSPEARLLRVSTSVDAPSERTIWRGQTPSYGGEQRRWSDIPLAERDVSDHMLLRLELETPP